MNPTSPFELRPATPADAPTLLRLIRELAQYERLADSVVATEDDIRRGLFGPGAAARAVIAWAAGEPAGFAVWYETFSTFRGRPGTYVEDLFVAPAQRGRGIGRALLRHVAAVALERGCFRLQWEVLRWNEQAIRFYERLGAVRSDDWDLYSLSGAPLSALAAKEPATQTTA